MKRQWSKPVLYDWGGDISKRWYVYYQFRNPLTGKLARQGSISTGINHHQTKADRYAAAKVLIAVITTILENGYNPYVDEAQFVADQIKKLTIPEAVTFVLSLKKNQYGQSGYKSFENHLSRFKRWLEENGFKGRLITAVNKTAVINYLNQVLISSSAASRNNARSNLSVFFQVLEDNEIIVHNFISKIDILKARPERNKSYTPEQENDIFDFLASEHTLLLVYIMFVSYNFVRPIEVSRLRVKDVDQKNRRLYYRAKNKPVKIKIIPEIMARELPDLGQLDQNSYLFGMTSFGQTWESSEVSRRDYYTKLFLRVVKAKFQLDSDYTIYSFRHTFIAKLYQAFIADGLTPGQSEDKLMLITGHTTKSALRAYLRDIDAVLPQDYSVFLK